MIKADYSPQDLEDGFKEMTIKGSDLLVALNFKDLFSELPANAEFVVEVVANNQEDKRRKNRNFLVRV